MLEARKRIVVKKPGSYGVFSFDETPLNPPGPGEVQVDVKACGINFADICVRLGIYAAAKGTYPVCPGLEFAGFVRRTGSGVKEFQFGDKIFGVTRLGGYATAINCPVEQIWPLPETWDFTRGATFPVAYLTAYYGLHHIGHLGDSERVLIHSAAGGVGTALLHLLSLAHAHTKAPPTHNSDSRHLCVGVVGRAEKIAHAKAAGAQFVIDKSNEPLWKRAEEISPEGYDLILDANGASTLRDSYRHIRSSGRLLVYGFASMLSHSGRKNWPKLIWDYLRTPRFSPFDLTGANKSICGFNLIYLFDKVRLFRNIMDSLLELDAAGLLPDMPSTPFTFEDIVRAHQSVESGRTIGKVVLTV